MPIVPVDAQVTAADLMKAVTQLNARELEDFVGQVLALRAQRQTPALHGDEQALLQTINRGMADSFWRRYRELADKRRQESLTVEEHRELLSLSDELESAEVQRLTALTELARIRQLPLSLLLDELEIQPTAHG
ncbi:MAG: STAS/SEC14 domain-containing protein [Planctomycetia bacterium]|nr:STAS/SEC14 domain-containing protein [Planctomycetia bacterium]